jgi:hypothetical protein
MATSPFVLFGKKARSLAHLLSNLIIAYHGVHFNTLKRISAGVFVHPLEQPLSGDHLPLAHMEGGEVGTVQQVVSARSGQMEIGLQVFCGKDFGKGSIVIHVISPFCHV